ncbi:hypothetical protein H4W33_010735 [Kibdelosporangium phytohabitans]|nr:hypothetical protein [Kibdelosporangium phytohabitans]
MEHRPFSPFRPVLVRQTAGTTQTEWKVGADTRVIVHLRNEWDSPRLFMADASNSVEFVVALQTSEQAR